MWMMKGSGKGNCIPYHYALNEVFNIILTEGIRDNDWYIISGQLHIIMHMERYDFWCMRHTLARERKIAYWKESYTW